jgi:hypothetical protein
MRAGVAGVLRGVRPRCACLITVSTTPRIGGPLDRAAFEHAERIPRLKPQWSAAWHADGVFASRRRLTSREPSGARGLRPSGRSGAGEEQRPCGMRAICASAPPLRRAGGQVVRELHAQPVPNGKARPRA